MGGAGGFALSGLAARLLLALPSQAALQPATRLAVIAPSGSGRY